MIYQSLMLEAVIVGLICVVLAWGIWKTRDWKPPPNAKADLDPVILYNEVLRDTGKHDVRLDRLESELKNIRSEWENYRSSVDSIVRRGIRHKVLDAQVEEEKPKEEDEQLKLPLSRSDLLRIGIRGANNG